jgi:hypothetical protein
VDTDFGASAPYTIAVEEDLEPLLLSLFAVVLRGAYQATEVEEHILLIFAWREGNKTQPILSDLYRRGVYPLHETHFHQTGAADPSGLRERNMHGRYHAPYSHALFSNFAYRPSRVA